MGGGGGGGSAGGGGGSRGEFGKRLYQPKEDDDREVVNRLNKMAGEKRVPPAQLALAWMLHQPAVTAPIIGATKMSNLDDAVAALALKLSPNDIASLEEPYVPHPVLGFS